MDELEQILKNRNFTDLSLEEIEELKKVFLSYPINKIHNLSEQKRYSDILGQLIKVLSQERANVHSQIMRARNGVKVDKKYYGK